MKNAIIMLTYNRKDYTEKTLKSYESQLKSSGHSFDFHIYDNGSTDGTADFLKTYRGKLSLNIVYGEKNIGIADATKYLLKEKCFGKGYDFIIKVDDDEILPDGWPRIMDHWNNIEESGAPVIGFKRREINEYFEGLHWVSCQPENMKMIQLGEFECYRSIASPGVQITTEYWWKEVYNDLTDLGTLYGGWDYTFMEALVRLKKHFLVVMNFETHHFQINEDFREFTDFKMQELEEFKKRHEEKWQKTKKDFMRAIAIIDEMKKQQPNNPKILELEKKAEEIRRRLDKK